AAQTDKDVPEVGFIWLSPPIATRLLYHLLETPGCVVFRADRNPGAEELSQNTTSQIVALAKEYGYSTTNWRCPGESTGGWVCTPADHGGCDLFVLWNWQIQ